MMVGITGASGHIGNNLVRALLKKGHTVRVLVHEDTRSLKDLPAAWVRGSILDPSVVDDFAAGLDVIYHLMSHIFIGNTGKKRFFAENIQATENILRVSVKSKIRLIHFSSIHAYDPFPLSEPLDEKRPLVTHDRFLYNRSKAITHNKVMDALSSGLQGVILCPTAVLGPGDYKPSLLGEAIYRLAKGKMPALIPGGYDWVDVRDVVDAAVKVLDTKVTGEDFLLSGHWISLAEVDSMIKQIGGRGKHLAMLPSWLAKTGAPFLEGWAKVRGRKPLYTSGSVTFLKHSHRNILSGKAETALGYSSRPFEETLSDTLQWLEQNLSLKL